MRKKRYTRWAVLFWLIVLLPFLVVGAMLLQASMSQLPTFEELENPKTNLASEVYTTDQKLLGTYFRENRSNVNFDEISPHVVNALIATEDERFYSHSGIDLKALLRVVKGVVTFNLNQGGGSTITQQLAKMLFHERPDVLWERIKQKFKEWIISVRLERQYTKNEILTMYLNKFDFINNAVGIKSAAHVYFATSPDSLTIEQAAMLVGMAKNPSLFNPLRRPEMAKQRRGVVLRQMVRSSFLSKEECDSLKELPLGLKYKKVDHNEGPAPYFREILRQELSRILKQKNPETEDYVIKKPDGEPYDIYGDGLKVFTTIDARMQEYAEWAIQEHLSKELQLDFNKDLKKRSKRNQSKIPFDWRVTKKEIKMILEAAIKRTDRYERLMQQECKTCEGGKIPMDSVYKIFNTPVPMTIFSHRGEIDTLMSPMDSIKYHKSILQAGMMAMDPQTGFVKVWVGGINHKYFKYDHVKQSRRQVGSTFKPFVYATAIREGMSPCMEIPNVVTCFDMPEGQPIYCPKNSDGEYGGMVTLKYGLANSMNTVTSWIMKQYGPEAVTKLARDMGVKSPLDPVPSLCLGVADLSVHEIVAANGTFANKGVYVEPIIVTRIEDKNGNAIYNYVPETNEALDERTAYIMLGLMKGVVDGAYNQETGKILGTGLRLRSSSERYKKYGDFPYPVAGKTGTTQNNSDGWFVGITPSLVSGIWVGAEDRSVRFSTTTKGQGANMALPIWGYFMNKAYGDSTLNLSKEDFEKPEFELGVELNCKEHFADKDREFDFEKN